MLWRFVPLAALAVALTSALAAAPSLAQTPPGTTTPSPAATTPAPAGTPWPAPTGISLETSVTVTNPDGSFIPLELRTATNTITWDLMPGFTGVYEVQRSQSPRGATQPRSYTQLNVIPAANAVSGKLQQVDVRQFLDQLQFEFCYRVRTVINGETGPFTHEVCTIPPPSTGPGTPPRTSVPGHPLQVLFGPQPSGSFSSAHPDLPGPPTVQPLESVRRVVPHALPASVNGYWVSSASLAGGPGKFGAQAWFRGEGDRLLVVNSWTKTGEFVTGAPANSPVTDAQQTYIEGLAALTFMPTSAVVGGIGPRSLWMTDGETIWHLDFMAGYSDNAEALALAAEVARAVRAPGPPGTGTSQYTSRWDTSSLPLLLASVALATGFAGLTLSEWRRRSR